MLPPCFDRDDMPTQNPRVLIATPTRGAPKMQFMQSVIGTIKDLARRGIEAIFTLSPALTSFSNAA
jgi:hypothetical protein